jgi:hypothetical protein
MMSVIGPDTMATEIPGRARARTPLHAYRLELRALPAIARFLWRTTRGYRLRPWASPYLRWRIETYWGWHADQIGAREFWAFTCVGGRDGLSQPRQAPLAKTVPLASLREDGALLIPKNCLCSEAEPHPGGCGPAGFRVRLCCGREKHRIFPHGSG